MAKHPLQYSRFNIQHSKFNKQGFSLVELLVVVAILAVLSVAAYIGIQRSGLRTMNEKVTSDLQAIESALEQYKQDKGHYPIFADLSLGANKNVLCFDETMAYAHDCEKAAFLQTQVDNELLTKRYLQEVPTDPRTGSRYSYGVTADGQSFELAGIQQNNDDTWNAKVVMRLEVGLTLPSLIRAFDAPNFVVEGGSFLPYSPTPNQVTARLNGVKGTVMVNNAVGIEGQVLKVGDTIKTSAGSTVVLYISDGSITYLDENSELQLLPSSEVLENSKDDIITKIRMKLFEGTAWNKVVRLAEKSEFNIETTSAIAGVRGTEFGINAKTNEIVVLSGTVAGRLKTAEEQAQSNGPGQALAFNVKDAFMPTQDSKEGNGEVFNLYKVPAKNQAMGQPTPLTDKQANEYLLKYYQSQFGLSAGYVPYIVKAQAHANGSYTLYVTFNGVESEGDLSIDGFDLYGESQTADIRVLKDDVKPLWSTDKVTYDPQEKAYAFDLETYAKNKGDKLYNADKGEMESILVKAFYNLEDGPTYSQLSWPAIGLEPSPNEEYAYTFKNEEAYPNLDEVKNVEPLAINEPEDPTLALNEGVFNLTSTQACDWSVEPATSGTFLKFEGLNSADYYPLKPNMSQDELTANVMGRFDGKKSEQVTIKCTDPNDAAKFDTTELTVNYAPKTVSDSYKYSYTSKFGGFNWFTAFNTCKNLKEGGLVWSLPSKAIYEGVDLEKEKASLCTWNGQQCSEPVKYFPVIETEGNNGYIFKILDNGYITASNLENAPQLNSYAFRCIVQN